MNDVLKALDRKEEVTILYRGIVKGRIVSETGKSEKKVQDHLYFGMTANEDQSVLVELKQLRESRVNAI
jgi:hypothetical protein